MFPNTEGTMPTVTKMHFIEMLKEHVGLSRAEANEVAKMQFYKFWRFRPLANIASRKKQNRQAYNKV